MTREEIERELDEYSTREQVSAKLKKAGLPRPLRVDDADTMLEDWELLKKQYGSISNIPFNQLGDYLDKWTALIAYARWVEANADIDQATSREIRDTVKKQLYCICEGSRELRDALVHKEPIYREYEKKFVEASAMYIATKSLREGYEYRANTISREITRRGSDFSDTSRAHNRGNR